LDSALVPLNRPCDYVRLTHRQGRTHIARMDGKIFGLSRPIITVVQPTQSIMGKHATQGYAASSAPRRSLAQSKMCAVFVMVGDVLGKQPPWAQVKDPDLAFTDWRKWRLAELSAVPFMPWGDV